MNIDKLLVFDTLYKINNNNKIYCWNVKLFTDNNNVKIRTSHGEYNGKKVLHETIIDNGKSNRTIVQQANLIANRKWLNKKEKEGYTEKKPTFEIIENSELKKSDNELNNQKIKFIRPMLAQTFDFNKYIKSNKSKKIIFPAFCQRKYDGIRCLIYLKDGKVNLESRTGKQFENFENLKKEINNFYIKNKLNENIYLDGELYTNLFPFETLSGLVRLKENKLKKENLENINKIKFIVFDMFDINNLNITNNDREQILSNYIFKNFDLIEKCETNIINNIEEVKLYHQKFIDEYFEGLILRNKNGIYEIDKRSYDLQKYKTTIEDEFKIVDFTEGDGDEKGSIIWICENKDKKKFNVRPKGTFENRSNLFKNGEKYIGKNLTVIFQEYTKDNIPRFPIGKDIRFEY